MRKASNFANFAKEHGWQSKCTQEGIVVRLFARRGENETLEIQWHDGCVLTEFAPVYSLAGERIKVRNLSAASKVIQEKPDPKRLAKATRKRKRQTGIDYSGGPLRVMPTGSLGTCATCAVPSLDGISSLSISIVN